MNMTNDVNLVSIFFMYSIFSVLKLTFHCEIIKQEKITLICRYYRAFFLFYEKKKNVTSILSLLKIIQYFASEIFLFQECKTKTNIVITIYKCIIYVCKHLTNIPFAHSRFDSKIIRL